MKEFILVGVALVCVLGLVSVSYMVGRMQDDERLQIEYQSALVKAQAKLETAKAQGEIQKTEALTELERVKLQNSPEVIHATKTKAVLSAWFPVYFPALLFAGVSSLCAVYFSFRLVQFQHDNVLTRVRVLDASRLVHESLQVKALEATQGVNVLQLAEQIQQRNMSSLGTLARGMRGLFGREQAGQNSQAALPPAIDQSAVNVSFERAVNDFKKGSILIGYQSDAPVYFALKDFVSCAFGGGSGSGKTSKLRFLTAQLILQGVNVSILDAHMGNEQSLVDSLGNLVNMPNVRVFNPFETQQAIGTMLSEVQAAINAGKPDDVPCVYVLDELRPLNRACDQVESLLDRIANEGRKYDRFMVASSQTWEASLFGKLGSAARDACVLKMAANMPKEQARILFKENDTAKKVCRLKRPEMYAQSSIFDGVVYVPFCSRDDLNELVKVESTQQAQSQEVYQKETQAEETITAEELDDTLLIRRIKERFPRNNELARLIDRDKGQVSDALNNGKLTPSLRNAFTRLLQI